MSTGEGTRRGLNILCLDGGGARGLSSLLLLKETMKRTQKLEGNDTMPEPYEYFDVIAGTGTGAVQACMLGRLRIPLQLAIDTYIKLVKDVFSEKKRIGSGAFKTTKLKEAIKRIVRNATGDEDQPVMKKQPSQDECKTIVFAMSKHNMNAGIPTMFRSYRAFVNEGPNCTIWEALCASMAHPELFRSFVIDGSGLKQSFVDAGFGCNNPLEHVLAEVKSIYPQRHIASVLSIGAGHTRTIQIPEPSLLQLFLPVNVMLAMKNMAADGERVAQHMSARFSKIENVYFRLNVDKGTQSVRLSDWELLNEVAAHTQAYTRRVEVNQRVDKVAQVVKGRKAAIAVEQIDGEIQGVSAKEVGMKRCPAPTPVFTGREDETKQVETCILSSESESRICIIHGLGGAGKTQLALKAIENTFDKWSDIIYMDASSRDSITNTLRTFAVGKKIGKTHEDTIEWLESNREPWLLVFDNADDPSFSLRDFFPNRNHGGILVTTRLSSMVSLAQGPNSSCKVSSMKPEEALALLLKTARIQHHTLSGEELGIATRLLKDFDHLALAIAHAGAFIQHSPHTTIPRYRQEFLARRQHTLESYGKLPPAKRTDDYTKTVYTVWVMCYELLGPQARALLWLIAFLHYDGITEDIFQRAAIRILSYEPEFSQTEHEVTACSIVRKFLTEYLNLEQSWDGILFSETIGEISSRSLIEYDPVNKAYRMHLLVQDWAHTVIPYPHELARECSRTLAAMSIDCSSKQDSIHFRIKMLPHVRKLAGPCGLSPNHAIDFSLVYKDSGNWNALVGLQNTTLELRKQKYSSEHPSVLSSIEDVASTYWRQGRWDEAATLQVKVLDLRTRVLGNEHPDTLTSMGNLALTYSDQGRWDKAATLQVQVLDIRKRVLGDKHPDTPTGMSNLALTYWRQGRWDEAATLQVQVLDIRKRVLGDEHPDTLTSMSDLASTYWRQGRWDEAATLQVQVLDIQRRVLGDEHPDTLIGISNLASTYSCQGRWNEAATLQVQVQDIRKRVLGEDHPDTLIGMSSLSSTYSCQGRWNEAAALQVQVLGIQKRVLGDEHPDTLIGISNLASTYSCQGRWNEAAALQVQVLDIRERALGDGHPDTLTSMSDLALTCSRQGQWEEAATLQVQVLDIQKRVLGDEHPDTLIGMSNLASTYSCQGRWDGAATLQVRVLDIRKRVLGKEHPDTLIGMSNLASTYSRQGRWDEAATLQVQVLVIRERALGDEHPDTLTSMSDLALTYWRQGRWDEAAILQVRVLDIQRRMLGDEHPDTLIGISNLASTYSCQGRWNEAATLQVQVLEIRKRVLGDEHPDTLIGMSNLASTYSRQGRWDKAAALQVQVLDIRERVLGDEHPGTLISMSNLASTYSCQGRWNEAAAVQVQVLDIRERVLGEEHPDTLIGMSNLAMTYLRQGRWDEAATLQVQVLDISKRVLGEEHPHTLVGMSNLASTYSRQGRLGAAAALQVQELEIGKRVLGDEHPDTLTSMNNLASTYSRQGRWDEAATLQVQVLNIRKQVLGDEHPATLTSMSNLASTYSRQGRWSEAAQLQTHAVKASCRVLGHKHPHTLRFQENLEHILREKPERSSA